MHQRKSKMKQYYYKRAREPYPCSTFITPSNGKLVRNNTIMRNILVLDWVLIQASKFRENHTQKVIVHLRFYFGVYGGFRVHVSAVVVFHSQDEFGLFSVSRIHHFMPWEKCN